MLNFMQDGGKLGLAALARVGGGLLGLAGTLHGNQAAIKLMELPKVQANRERLPAVNAPPIGTNGFEFVNKLGVLDTAANMVSLHFMSNVIYSMGSRLYSGLWGQKPQ
jgi:hypothetical protein